MDVLPYIVAQETLKGAVDCLWARYSLILAYY
jgi:hypothetical protein